MKNILQYSIWAGIYLLLLVPFIVANGMFFPYITGKAFIFRIVTEIIFGLWLVLIIKDKKFRPKFSWIVGCAALFTFILLIADIWAVAPYKALWSNFERMEGWVTIVHLLLYLLVTASMFQTERLWLWFFRANVLAGLVMALTSLDTSTEVRFSGPLGNPIYIGVYFLFIFFFAIILWHKEGLVKKVFNNILFYVYPLIAALSFYVAYRTSRGVLLGLIGGLLVSAILIAIFEKEKKLLRRISLGVIILVFLSVAGFFSARQSTFVKNNPTLSRLAEVSWSNVNGQARQYVWPMALKGFQEKPILGWGQEGFNYVFNKYYDPRMYAQEQWFDRAHNTLLDVLVAGGLLGLLSYLSIFGAIIYLLWFKRNTLEVGERAIISGLLAGYFFQGLFVFDNLVSYLLFFTVLAYVHSRGVEGEENKKAFGLLAGFVSSEDNQNYVLVPVVVIATVFSIWWVNIPALRANTTLLQALQSIQRGQITASLDQFKQALSYQSLGDSEIREQLLSLAPSIAQASSLDKKIREDFVDLTFNEANTQIMRVPQDARYYILTGSFLNNVGAYEQALPYIQKAVELSPAKQTMRFELVRALASLGRLDEAVKEATDVYELDKSYDQAKLIYDTVLDLKKKK